MQQISKKSNFNHGFTIVELPTSLKLPTSQMLCRTNHRTSLVKSGFTIVELLVVIVVIGILAAITIVSYTGISNRAKVATLQSDLSNASQQLKIFQATDASGNYPTANTCPTPGATEICLKASNDNTYIYTPNSITNPKTFTLKATNGDTIYRITDDSKPVLFVSLAVSDPANWLAIGIQVWAKYNLNIGTRINGTLAQTNNGGTNIVEKYCYGDTDAGCTNTDSSGIAYGGLYQWDEAMQYVTTEGTQGICPTGSHIPTDAEWAALETYLSPATAGTQLKSGGTSGLNMPLAGHRRPGGSFTALSSYGNLWSSSESSTSAWRRTLISDIATVDRGALDEAYGFSVRCLGN